jgi:hypothetical protein
MSCARTLALKYKMRQAAKAFKKFGKNLRDPNSKSEKTKLYIPKSLTRTRQFKIKAPIATAMMEVS